MNCKECQIRNTCVKICEKVEKILKKNGIYNALWIRPQVSKEQQRDGKGRHREVNFTSLGLDFEGKPLLTAQDK